MSRRIRRKPTDRRIFSKKLPVRSRIGSFSGDPTGVLLFLQDHRSAGGNALAVAEVDVHAVDVIGNGVISQTRDGHGGLHGDLVGGGDGGGDLAAAADRAVLAQSF